MTGGWAKRCGNGWQVVLCVAGAATLFPACAESPVATPPAAVLDASNDGGGGASTADASSEADANAGDAERPEVDGSGAEPPKLDGGGGCTVVHREAELERVPVDIVWAIDGSPSMFPHTLQASQGIDAFNTAVEQSGADIRVVVLASNDPAPGAPLTDDPERYLYRQKTFGAQEVFRTLLDEHEDGFGSFLRRRSPTHIVVMTDSSNLDDSGLGMGAADFRQQMEAALGGPIVFHAIAPSAAEWTGSVDTPEFGALADATGGQHLPITALDWSPIVEQLETSLVQTSLPCEVELPDVPGADLSRVRVEHTGSDGVTVVIPASSAGGCAASGGWVYDDLAAPRTIELCPDSCEAVKQEGGQLDVRFDCVRLL